MFLLQVFIKQALASLINPPVGPIMKEVAPSHTSPQVFALGSDLEEGEISLEVSSQSLEPSVLVSNDGLQNQHLSLRDFVGDMGKV